MLASHDPSAPVVVTPSEVVSYGSLLRTAAAAGELFSDLGLPERSAVPALLDAGPTAYALWVGGAGSRRPVAPLAPRSTVAELQACLRPDDAPVVVASPAYAAVAAKLAAATGRRAVP